MTYESAGICSLSGPVRTAYAGVFSVLLDLVGHEVGIAVAQLFCSPSFRQTEEEVSLNEGREKQLRAC